MKLILMRTFLTICSIFLSVFIVMNVQANEKDPFYEVYLLQRIRIAKIREMRSDPTARSLLRFLTEEAKNVGMTLPKWAQPNNLAQVVPITGAASSETLNHRYKPLVYRASDIYGLPPALIMAVIHVESAFVKDAVSNKGAQGLMQLMPETADDIGVNNPFDPKANIFGGTRLLKKHLLEFRSLKKALIAYNAGPDWVRKRKGIPMETKKYIKNVIAQYQRYKKISDNNS